MPLNVFSRWWLFILLCFLFFCHFFFLTHLTISHLVQNSQGDLTFPQEEYIWLYDSLISHPTEGWRPGLGRWNLEENTILMLNIAWIVTMWRTGLSVKNRTSRWIKSKVRRWSMERNAARNEISDLHRKKEDLEDQLERMERTLTSIIMDNRLLKKSYKACEVEAEILRSTLKKAANRLQQREGILQQELSQEKVLHQEKEAKLISQIKAFEQDVKSMNMEGEAKENSYKTQIRELRRHLADMEKLLSASQLENEELKECYQAFQASTSHLAEEMLGLKASIKQERTTHLEEMNTLKNQLILMQEKQTTLQQKLAQEKVLFQETEASKKEIKMEWEKKEKSRKAQIKELLEYIKNTEKLVYSARVENEELKVSCKAFQTMKANMAEEMLGLKATIEQERTIHLNENQTLQKELETVTIVMQEKEATLLQKLAEEENKTAQAYEKFKEYKNDLLKVTKERQQYLKNEIRLYQKRAQDNLMAYRDTEQNLTRERRKTADLQRRLDALDEKWPEKNRTPRCGRNGAAESGFQVTLERPAGDQHFSQRHERQSGFRAHRGNHTNFY